MPEEVLVVLQVYARLAVNPGNNLELLKFYLGDVLLEVVQEGSPEAGQEVLSGVLVPFALFALLGLGHLISFLGSAFFEA